jgi:hypothetical protein
LADALYTSGLSPRQLASSSELWRPYALRREALLPALFCLCVRFLGLLRTLALVVLLLLLHVLAISLEHRTAYGCSRS